jgi:hypothetical protein
LEDGLGVIVGHGHRDEVVPFLYEYDIITH